MTSCSPMDALFLDSIGCFEDQKILPDQLMSHIMKCIAILILKHPSSHAVGSKSTTDVFLKSVIGLCEEGLERQESPKPPLITPKISLSNHFYETAATDAVDIPPRRSVWSPIHWAAMTKEVGASRFADLVKNEVNAVAATVSCDDSTAGHYAASVTYDNTAVLSILSRYFPRMAFAKDKNGDLPLHRAARFTDSVEILSFLIKENPGALSSANHDGQTPLHIMAARMKPYKIELLDCLLEIAPSAALLAQDNGGDTALHSSWHFVAARMPAVFLRLLDANPEAAFIANNDAELPIHTFCTRPLEGSPISASGEELQTITERLLAVYALHGSLDAEDSPLLQTEFEGISTPLCLACSYGGNTGYARVIKLLIEACPRAATAPNLNADLPLQLFLENWYRAAEDMKQEPFDAIEIIRLFIATDPAVMGNAFQDGHSPLYLAAWLWKLPVVSFIYKAFPQAVSDVFSMGWVPLHGAARNGTSDSEAIIRYLYLRYPDATRMQDHYGRAPIHNALICSLKNTKILHDLDPLAIELDGPYNPLSSRTVAYFTRWFSKCTIADTIARPQSESDTADRLRFLLKHYPQGAAALATCYPEAQAPQHQYFRRLVLRALPEKDPQRLHDLNNEARRGALYLLRSAIPSGEHDMVLWLRLRELNDLSLLTHIVSFL